MYIDKLSYRSLYNTFWTSPRAERLWNLGHHLLLLREKWSLPVYLAGESNLFHVKLGLSIQICIYAVMMITWIVNCSAMWSLCLTQTWAITTIKFHCNREWICVFKTELLFEDTYLFPQQQTWNHRHLATNPTRTKRNGHELSLDEHNFLFKTT